MDIDFSESDDGNNGDDEEQIENEEDVQFDPKSLEEELAEKDIEQEKMIYNVELERYYHRINQRY